jgi:hypothetical protein
MAASTNALITCPCPTSPLPSSPGGSFSIRQPGRYVISPEASSLSHCLLRSEEGPPICLVCDLDGTLVGRDDEGTAAFRDWWMTTGLVRGGLLVFNTGRWKQWALAIAAVHDATSERGCLLRATCSKTPTPEPLMPTSQVDGAVFGALGREGGTHGYA